MRGWICDLVAEHLSTVARPWGQQPLQEHNEMKGIARIYSKDMQTQLFLPALYYVW